MEIVNCCASFCWVKWLNMSKNQLSIVLSLVLFTLSTVGLAEKTSLKVDSPTPSAEGSTIEFKKGVSNRCVEYQIIDGTNQVVGGPAMTKKEAYTIWNTVCGDWQKAMRELNKDSKIISLGCGTPTFAKDGEDFTYSSKGEYKVRVKIKDKE